MTTTATNEVQTKTNPRNETPVEPAPIVSAPRSDRKPQQDDHAKRVERITAQADKAVARAKTELDEIIGLIQAQTGTTTCSFCQAQHLDPFTVRHQKVDGKVSTACSDPECLGKFRKTQHFNLAESLRRKGEAMQQAKDHAKRLRLLSGLTGHEARGARQVADQKLAEIEARFTEILGRLVVVTENDNPVRDKYGRVVKKREGNGELEQAGREFEGARQATENAKIESGKALANCDSAAAEAANAAYLSAQQEREDRRMLVRTLENQLYRLEAQSRPWHECKAVIPQAPRYDRNERGNGQHGRNNDRKPVNPNSAQFRIARRPGEAAPVGQGIRGGRDRARAKAQQQRAE